MLCGSHVLVDLRDISLRVDEEALPPRDAEREIHAVALDDLAVRVREERKGEAVLLRELLLRFDGVLRDADDGDVFRVLRAFVTEGTCFDRSPGGVGFRIEEEDDTFPLQP